MGGEGLKTSKPPEGGKESWGRTPCFQRKSRHARSRKKVKKKGGFQGRKEEKKAAKRAGELGGALGSKGREGSKEGRGGKKGADRREEKPTEEVSCMDAGDHKLQLRKKLSSPLQKGTGKESRGGKKRK